MFKLFRECQETVKEIGQLLAVIDHEARETVASVKSNGVILDTLNKKKPKARH